MSVTRRITVGQKVTRVTVGPQTVRVTTTQSTQTRVRMTAGTIGPQGPAGAAGPTGPAGLGVPVGGLDGQVLTKQSGTDYDSDWETPATGVTDHLLLSNIGVNTHAQIDTHIASTANPHGVTAAQVGALTDAPSDGTTYGRKDGAWVAVVGTVISVNGQTGIVVLDTDDLAEGVNLFNRFPAGGTAGQVLKKVDGTDFNATWQFNTVNAGNIDDWLSVGGDFPTAVATTTNVSLNTMHRLTTSGNPHNVLEADLSDLGTLTMLRADNDYTTNFSLDSSPGTGDKIVTEDQFGGFKTYCTLGTLPVSTPVNTALNLRLLASDNLTDVASQQTALNNITAVAGATNEHVLTKDTGTGNAVWKAAAGGASAIGDLTDVTIATPADNEVLAYDNGSGDWINQTAAEAGLASASDLTGHTGASTGVHGITGAVVGTTDTQTLSAKTLTTPTIDDFTNAQHTHAGASSGGTIAHSALTGVGTNTHAQIDTHIATISGNPHGVTLADVGGTTDHTALSNIGTNTHAQIDTHLALVNEHVDWTNASADFLTTGTVQVAETSVATTEDLIFANMDLAISGTFTTEIVGYNCDIDATYAASTIRVGSIKGYKFRYNAVDNGALAIAAPVMIVDGQIDAAGMPVSDSNGSQPIYYRFANPASTQGFVNGFMRVDVTSGSGMTIAFYSSSTISGAGNGLGYRGHVACDSTGTGSLKGVEGYAFPNSAAAFSESVCLEGTQIGTSRPGKRMGLRTNAQILVRGGLIVNIDSIATTTPDAHSMTHMDATAGAAGIYTEGDAEIDGELFCDGNISKAVTDVSSTPHTVLTTDTMVDATGGAHVENLPAISGLSGNREVVIKKVDASANAVTVTANGSDTIDGTATRVLSSQYDHVRLVAGNGTEWHVVG